MFTERPQRINSIPFQENATLQQIPFQLKKAARRVLFNLKGTITISNKAGNIYPVMGAASDGSTVWPYLLNLMGSLTFNGTRLDGTTGLKINAVPFWALWLRAYLLHLGTPPFVYDGGMQAAGFAAGTYNVEVNVPVEFFDPRTPEPQHMISFFRPVCYNQQPFFQVNAGQLFQAQFQDSNDNVSLTGDDTGSLTYTTNLVLKTTTYVVPSMAIHAADDCADLAIEYIPNFGLNNSTYNNINTADNDVQAYLHLINTNKVLRGTGANAYTEAGADTMGDGLNGIVQTYLGDNVVVDAYAANVKENDYQEFMASLSAFPAGLLSFDMYGHNWRGAKGKTFLGNGSPQFKINANGQIGAAGSNFRVLHETFMLSAVSKKKMMPFAPYDGQ
jgi:hypothetical protein